MATKKKKGGSMGKAVAVGATIAAATAAAYLLFGPEGKKNRKTLKGWAVKMKGEMIEKFEKTKDLTEDAYHKIIEEVSKKYGKLSHVDAKDIEKIAKEARVHWKKMTGGTKKKASRSKKK